MGSALLGDGGLTGKLGAAIPVSHPRPQSAVCGYFTLNERHFVAAALCAAVLAIVAFMR